MAYRIPWFYFGDTHCLVEGLRQTESTALAGVDGYGSLDFAVAQAWSPSDPPAEPAVTSPFFQDIADLTAIENRPSSPMDFRWNKGPLRRLAVRAVDMSPYEVTREYVLTPDTMYLPWPFFPDLAPGVWTPPPSAAPTIQSFDVDAISGDYICLGAALDAVDVLAECPSPQNSHIQSIPNAGVEQAIRDTAKTLGYDYDIGQFSAVKRPNLPIHETRVRVDPDAGTLQIEIGAQAPAPVDEDGPVIFIPAYPCGAFSGTRRTNCPTLDL